MTGVESVVVHASPRPVSNSTHNNDLETSVPLGRKPRQEAKSTAFAPPPPAPLVQPIEPVRKGSKQQRLAAGTAEELDPIPPKCACCFM